MIDEINNVSAKQLISPTIKNSVFDKTAENAKSDKSDQRGEETKTRNVIENGKLIVEYYDRHGKLIRKNPPGYLPPGEKC